MDTLSTNQKVLISALVGFVIGAGAVVVWNISRGGGEVAVTNATGGTVAQSDESPLPNNEEDKSAMVGAESQASAPVLAGNGGDSITVLDQAAGNAVRVENIEFENAGWVAVHEDRNGGLGNILGAAWFPRGTSSGTVELLRDTLPGQAYYAVLYTDNGNKVFETGVDAQIVTASGNPVMSTFITLGAQ